MACPFFYPTEKSYTVAWSFPRRLPLGAGFCGTCRARYEETTPDDATLRECCNLGHAVGCGRLPATRQADSVRFSVAEDSQDQIVLAYVYDRGHLPVVHGKLEYDCGKRRWSNALDDPCVQRQAECYLTVYLERRRGAAADH